MKKVFLVLPLAILLANCSSTRNTNSTATNSGTNASAGTTASSSVNSDATTSSSTSGSTASATGSMNNSTSNSANWNSNNNSTSVKNSGSTAKTSGSINWDVYDPNNYMQNPDKYRKPYEIAKAGGWTYTKDWRRNTNFTADAVGEWQLKITPEVASYWMPDTRRPETYASFWTPEAVMARYEARVAAILKTQDSLAALNAANSGALASTGSNNTASENASASTTTSDNSATAANTTTAVTGSGSTGAMGTGGTSSTTSDATANANATSDQANSGVTTPFLLKAVNGNNYLLPKLNLFIDNGSFTAYTGCNNALGKIIVEGSTLHFEETTPSSNIECIGGFDQSAFLDRLRRADSYDVVNNQFRIKQGDQVLMTFEKGAPKL